MVNKALLAFSFLSLSALAWAQDQAELKRHFEGMEVTVKMDMPGDKSGVDIHVEEGQRVDFSEVGKRLKRYGVSIRRGDRAMVTLVKVNKRNIEFQLDGGGYGTLGDSVPGSSISTYVPKSDREKRLEEEVKRERDPKQKRRLQEQLDHLRADRERQEAHLRAEAARVELLRQAEERERRLNSGSRFNLWFKQSVPVEALTPEAVQAALADYVDFEASDFVARERDEGDWMAPSSFRLKKGLTEEELEQEYGEPTRREVKPLGEFTLTTVHYQLEDGELMAQFVEGILVRYSISSR
ncbi:MAG TPA: hypothetical protein PLP42_10385 [Acidobacteriota bacterium]|nr:hypothetical protein [Acidobacteriota bacterium]